MAWLWTEVLHGFTLHLRPLRRQHEKKIQAGTINESVPFLRSNWDKWISWLVFDCTEIGEYHESTCHSSRTGQCHWYIREWFNAIPRPDMLSNQRIGHQAARDCRSPPPPSMICHANIHKVEFLPWKALTPCRPIKFDQSIHKIYRPAASPCHC